ncbi:MAG TPA: pyridoxal-phosphate dependent enzyme [Cyclobacteriaceae bacterium]|nr:pyridoxal-phosphate dependent enzyme [Cyclobacteriaceae bacterium]
MARFSFADIQHALDVIDPVFTHTPQFECEPLGASLGCRVVLKLETLNPIRSFKGRGADLLTHHSKDKKIMCASAGNFGQAMAWCCRKRGIDLSVYASIHANAFKVARMKELGATVILAGEDFDAAKAAARTDAGQKHIRFVEDSLDVDTVVGAGTIGIELLRDGRFTPDFILVPLGNGALVNGISMAIGNLRPRTKVIAIQSANAPAMLESWKSGKIITHESIDTIADGIGVRIPVAEAVTEMKELVTEGLLVKEETLVKAMQLLRLHAGIIVEPSAAVGLAALLENRELFAGKSVVLILTGSNLTEQQLQDWFH